MSGPELDAAITTAMTGAVRRVLTGRAVALRSAAARQETITLDGRGRLVTIGTPEGVVLRGTAALFDEIAAELAR